MADPMILWDPATNGPVALGSTKTAGWDGTVVSMSGYEEAQVHVTGLGGGDSIAVKGSTNADGSNPIVLTGVNLNSLATLTSITADGLYSFPASAAVTYVKTGAGSTPTVNLLRR